MLIATQNKTYFLIHGMIESNKSLVGKFTSFKDGKKGRFETYHVFNLNLPKFRLLLDSTISYVNIHYILIFNTVQIGSKHYTFILKCSLL